MAIKVRGMAQAVPFSCAKAENKDENSIGFGGRKKKKHLQRRKEHLSTHSMHKAEAFLGGMQSVSSVESPALVVCAVACTRNLAKGAAAWHPRFNVEFSICCRRSVSEVQMA